MSRYVARLLKFAQFLKNSARLHLSFENFVYFARRVQKSGRLPVARARRVRGIAARPRRWRRAFEKSFENPPKIFYARVQILIFSTCAAPRCRSRFEFFLRAS
jgi:hypothetical protein